MNTNSHVRQSLSFQCLSALIVVAICIITACSGFGCRHSVGTGQPNIRPAQTPMSQPVTRYRAPVIPRRTERQQLSQVQLRDLARQAIHSHPRALTPTVLTVHEGGRELEYVAGSLTIERPGGKSEYALGRALDTQIRIELLRQALMTQEQVSFWEERLKEADGLVAQMLHDIYGSRFDSSPLLQRLDRTSAKVNALIRQGVEQYAAAHHLKVIGSSLRAKLAMFDVVLVTEPPGRAIQCVSELDYELAQLQGEVPPWQPVRGAPYQEHLLGTYRFTVDNNELPSPIDIYDKGEYPLRVPN